MKKRLYLSKKYKQLAGVCGGFAEYFDIDPTVVRLAWILLTVIPGGAGLILYIVAAIIMKEEPTEY